MTEEYPIHTDGTPAQLPWETVATFPVGTFLENIAARANGSLLVSDMLAGEIHYLDPNATNPQSTLKKVHAFLPEDRPADEEEHAGDYGSGMTGEALVEDLRTRDVFYTFSGRHGKSGTWAVYRLDMRNFEETSSAKVTKIAEVSHAVWLNGATFIPGSSKLVMAESTLGQLVCCDVDTGVVSIWLENPLLGKVTDRPPWPAANGVQYFRDHVFVINSDRAVLLSAQVKKESGEYVQNRLKVLVENLAGDDLAFDVEGAAYIATNPNQTVLKFPGVGNGSLESERLVVAGSRSQAETAGPTAVAFGRTNKDRQVLYVVTTGGLIAPVGDGPGPGRVFKVDVGVRGEA